MNKPKEVLEDKELDAISGGYDTEYWCYTKGPYAGKSGTNYMIRWNQDETEYGVFQAFGLWPVRRFSFFSMALAWIGEN